MYYEFDWCGWLCGIHETEQARCTTVVPSILDLNLVAGELRCNFTGYEWVEMAYTPPPPPSAGPTPEMKVTKLAFRKRFTNAEKVTLELASLDDPTKTMPERQLAASLRVSMADQRDASYIDLADAATRAGVEMLETYGLIAAGRATEILDTLPAPGEVPDAATVATQPF